MLFLRFLGIRTLAAGFALLGLSVGSLGCTLVSGWSDLQGGTPASGDAGATQDASLPPVAGDAGSGARSDGAPASGDSSSDGGAPTLDASIHEAGVDMTILCGATRCPLGEDCCAGVLSSATCQAPSASCQPPGTLESCSDSSQCTASLGHAASCCTGEQGEGLVVSCVTACVSSGSGTGSIVCDPTLAVPSCPSGMTCQASEGFDYSTCQ